jgi:hypothetical protein
MTQLTCQFCHQQPIDHKSPWACQECDDWLRTYNYSYSSLNGQLDVVWLKIKSMSEVDETITTIYFWIQKNRTIVETYQPTIPSNIKERWKKILDINYLLPITPKTLEDLPKKLKLWQTFS